MHIPGLKYRSGSGSRNLIFNGSGSRNLIFNGSVPVQVQDFSKIEVKVRFGLSCTKIERFGFGSDSMISNLNGSSSVRVHRKKAFFSGSRFRFRFGLTPCLFQTQKIFEKQKKCYASQHMSRDFY